MFVSKDTFLKWTSKLSNIFSLAMSPDCSALHHQIRLELVPFFRCTWHYKCILYEKMYMLDYNGFWGIMVFLVMRQLLWLPMMLTTGFALGIYLWILISDFKQNKCHIECSCFNTCFSCIREIILDWISAFCDNMREEKVLSRFRTGSFTLLFQHCIDPCYAESILTVAESPLLGKY